MRVYQSQDRLLARVVEALGDDTLVVLVSDHGAVADGPMFDPYKALVPAGLTVLEAEGEGQGHGYAGKVLKASRTVAGRRQVQVLSAARDLCVRQPQGPRPGGNRRSGRL